MSSPLRSPYTAPPFFLEVTLMNVHPLIFTSAVDLNPIAPAVLSAAKLMNFEFDTLSLYSSAKIAEE